MTGSLQHLNHVWPCGGVFAQRGHSANYYAAYPWSPLTYGSMHDPFKHSIGGAEFRTLGPVAGIRLKKKNPWCTSRGCRVQNSGP